MNMIEDNQNLN